MLCPFHPFLEYAIFGDWLAFFFQLYYFLTFLPHFSSIILVSLRLVHFHFQLLLYFHFHLIAIFSTIILHNKVGKYKCVYVSSNNSFDFKVFKLYDMQINTFTKIYKVKSTHIVFFFFSFHYTKECKCRMHCKGFHKMLNKSYTQQTTNLND
jgi:hypothetical protein